jgi:transcriptional regulator with XRE-family HTH domain
MKPDTSRMSIGQALSQEIERRGISHRSAAEIVGVTQQSFSKWVNDLNRPGPEHLASIARFLHLKVEDVRRMRANGAGNLEQRMSRIEGELAELRRAITRLLGGQS